MHERLLYGWLVCDPCRARTGDHPERFYRTARPVFSQSANFVRHYVHCSTMLNKNKTKTLYSTTADIINNALHSDQIRPVDNMTRIKTATYLRSYFHFFVFLFPSKKYLVHVEIILCINLLYRVLFLIPGPFYANPLASSFHLKAFRMSRFRVRFFLFRSFYLAKSNKKKELRKENVAGILSHLTAQTRHSLLYSVTTPLPFAARQHLENMHQWVITTFKRLAVDCLIIPLHAGLYQILSISQSHPPEDNAKGCFLK